jgi:hypothetical protein
MAVHFGPEPVSSLGRNTHRAPGPIEAFRTSRPNNAAQVGPSAHRNQPAGFANSRLLWIQVHRSGWWRYLVPTTSRHRRAALVSNRYRSRGSVFGPQTVADGVAPTTDPVLLLGSPALAFGRRAAPHHATRPAPCWPRWLAMRKPGTGIRSRARAACSGRLAGLDA